MASTQSQGMRSHPKTLGSKVEYIGSKQHRENSQHSCSVGKREEAISHGGKRFQPVFIALTESDSIHEGRCISNHGKGKRFIYFLLASK